MGVASGCGEQRWVWLVGEGGIYGCSCKEVYRFLHTTYPYSSYICSFLRPVRTINHIELRQHD